MNGIETLSKRADTVVEQARSGSDGELSQASNQIPSTGLAEETPNTITAFVVEARIAAQLCGVSRSTWFALKAAGRIPRPVRIGRRTLWRVDEIKAWLDAGCPPLHRWEQIAKGRWA